MTEINTPTYIRVREQIRADIASGIWALGTHVTMAELTDRYRVSANPVREALHQLQGEGVIDIRMNRGAVVPSVDARYIENIYRIRGALQVMLAREAAVRAKPADVERIRALCSAYEAAAANNDVGLCVQANRALHHFTDSLADNPPAVEILASRMCLVDALRRSIGYSRGRLDTVIAQHRKLARAIARGDADKAAQVAHEHTESARLDLLAALKRSH